MCTYMSLSANNKVKRSLITDITCTPYLPLLVSLASSFINSGGERGGGEGGREIGTDRDRHTHRDRDRQAD